jgi:hypothetical protein
VSKTLKRLMETTQAREEIGEFQVSHSLIVQGKSELARSVLFQQVLNRNIQYVLQGERRAVAFSQGAQGVVVFHLERDGQTLL